MNRSLAALGAAATICAVAVGIVEPAAALSTVTTSGTTMTVTLAGAETVAITCVSGISTISGKTGSPTVPCSALTKVTVIGDSGPQNVDGRQLEAAAFAAKPALAVDLGDGADLVYDTSRADQIDLGGGDDSYYPVRGVNNTTTDLGPGKDTIRFFGTDADETVTASSTNSGLTLHHELGGVTRTLTMSNGEDLQVTGYNGNNTIDLSGITVTSTIKAASIWTGSGDDVVRAPMFTGAQYAPGPTLMPGGGTNTIYGGSGNDGIFSEGNADVIAPGGGYNRVYDRSSRRSGRTISSGGQSNWYYLESNRGDAVTRIRPRTGSTTLVTNSLNRPGQQVLSADYSNIVRYLVYSGGGDSRGIMDLVALDNGRDVILDGDSADNDLVDITIPTGSWTVTGSPASTAWVTPSAAGYAPITVRDAGELRVHGPWTNKNAGFVHRATRDLMFRFATPTTISSLAVALGDGATTRPAIVSDLMDSDEYRGLDIDRVFTSFLHRKADAGGLAYWNDSIKNGNPLWRFRAQLFGSPEYFANAGGTNGQYVDAAYQDVLGRRPDAAGRQYWIDKLNAGTKRGTVALQFINTSESRRFLIDDQFLRFLDRKATPTEQSTWLPRISTPTGEQEMIAALVAGASYYDRT